MADSERVPKLLFPLPSAISNILIALVDGEKHGYAIMLKIEADTKGKLVLGPGTLFGSIKRMLAAGLIEQSDERNDPDLDDQRRRYYRLTGLGQRILHSEIEHKSSQEAGAQAKGLLGRAFLGGVG